MKKYIPVTLDQSRYRTPNPALLIQGMIEKDWLPAPNEKDLFIVEENLIKKLGDNYSNRFDYYLDIDYLTNLLSELKNLTEKLKNPQIVEILKELRETMILYLNGCTSSEIDESWDDFLNRPYVKSYFSSEFKY